LKSVTLTQRRYNHLLVELVDELFGVVVLCRIAEEDNEDDLTEDTDDFEVTEEEIEAVDLDEARGELPAILLEVLEVVMGLDTEPLRLGEEADADPKSAF
jgi:hypothetical protein